MAKHIKSITNLITNYYLIIAITPLTDRYNTSTSCGYDIYIKRKI